MVGVGVRPLISSSGPARDGTPDLPTRPPLTGGAAAAAVCVVVLLRDLMSLRSTCPK